MKINSKIKKGVTNASLFILGVVVTIIITKVSDKVSPNDPVLVKQVTDTIKIVHNYDLPKEIESDTVKKELNERIRNLELLNKYDEQIRERVKKINTQSPVIPNLIITQKTKDWTGKGYMYGSSLSYFASDCPNLNGDYIDIKLDFLNSEIIQDIAAIKLSIFKFGRGDKTDARTFILEDYYEVKNFGNLIRINNELEPGRYEFMYGFIFKNDLIKQYPTFYFKRCILIK